MKKRISIFLIMCFMVSACAATNLKYGDNKHVISVWEAVSAINYNSDKITDYKFKWKARVQTSDTRFNGIAYLTAKAQNQFAFHAYTFQGIPLISAASSINEISFIDYNNKKYFQKGTSRQFFALKQTQRFLPFFAYLKDPDIIDIFPEENTAVFVYNYEEAQVKVRINIKEKYITAASLSAGDINIHCSFSDYVLKEDFFIPGKIRMLYDKNQLTLELMDAEAIEVNSDMLYLKIPEGFERIEY